MRTELLAAPDGKETLRFLNAINPNIIEALEKDFTTAVKQTKAFAQKFKGATVEQSAQNVWNFLKDKITYKRDSSEKQMIRLPNRFVGDQAGDCKSYSLFAAAILYNLGIPVAFRYAGYNPLSTTPTHVYVVLPKHNIIVDGVWHTFNSEKQYEIKIDHLLKSDIPMDVVTLSDDVSGIGKLNLGKLKKRLMMLHPGGMQYMLLKNMMRRKRGLKPLMIPQDKLKMVISNSAIPFNNPYKLMAMQEMKGMHGVDEIDGIEGIGKLRIGKFFKKIAQGVKSLSLLPGRKAYLLMVRVNLFKLATRLAKVLAKDRAGLEKKWKKLGGKPSVLINAINKGNRKHAAKMAKKAAGIKGFEDYSERITGEDYAALETGFEGIGVAPLAAAIAAAVPIITALAPLLKKNKATGEDAAGNPLAEEPLVTAALDKGLDLAAGAAAAAAGEQRYASGAQDTPADDDPKIPDSDPDDKIEKNDPSAGFKINPMLLLAAGGGLLLLSKKR